MEKLNWNEHWDQWTIVLFDWSLLSWPGFSHMFLGSILEPTKGHTEKRSTQDICKD